MSPSSGRLKTLRCSTKLAKKDKIDKIVNNVVLQILQITHLPGHLERPEYECRPPCSTPQKQKVTEHVSCEGYSRVSGRWLRARRAPRGGACVARHLYSQMLHLYVTREDAVQRRALTTSPSYWRQLQRPGANHEM